MNYLPAGTTTTPPFHHDQEEIKAGNSIVRGGAPPGRIIHHDQWKLSRTVHSATSGPDLPPRLINQAGPLEEERNTSPTVHVTFNLCMVVYGLIYLHPLSI